MAKFIHAMLRVLDEKASINFYAKAFNLEIIDRFSFESFTLVYLKNKETNFEIELTINHDQSEPYTHGSGYGHLAVVVNDLEFEFLRFTEEGFNPTPIKEFNDAGTLMAKFFFVQDPDGYKIEVIQKHGRYI